MTFAKWITKKRYKAQLTQRDVSIHLGYFNGQFVSNWERGQCLPAIEALPTLARIYKIKKSILLERYLEATRIRIIQKMGG